MKTSRAKPHRASTFSMQAPMHSVLLTLLLSAGVNLSAQPEPHHFNGITVLPDRTTLLTLDGSVSNMFNLTGTISNQFMQMFDLYPVLSGATAVLFNGLSAQFTPGTDPDSEIVATVPPHATTGPVTVITPGGNITSLAPFTVPVLLALVRNGNSEVELSWCADACDLLLQASSNLTDWQTVPTSPSVGPDTVRCRLPLNGSSGFFRLFQP